MWPDALILAALVLAAAGCSAAAVAGIRRDTVVLSRKSPASSPAGGARFAKPSELRCLVRRCDELWFPLGYLPSRRKAGRPVYLPEEDLSRHLLVIGRTGAHKTTAVTFPALLEAARRGVSVVALDLKYGEEDSLARVAPEWWRLGRDVLVFAPLDPFSLRWNPLAECRSLGEAHRLAVSLFDDAESPDADLVYWVGVERHVCAALALALATDGASPTLARLRALCQAGPSAIVSYVRTHPDAGTLGARMGAFLAMLPKDQAGILQGIASRLEAWSDDAVCRATEVGAPWERIDLARLRREPVLLVLGMPQAALARLRWLCHLFLQDLAACLLRPRRTDERVRVLEVLEELPAWGPIPGLADHLATFRSRQVSVIATIQSEAQGESVYGRERWGAISANMVTKVIFPSLADFDAERLSRAMGTTAGEDVARSRGWGEGGVRRGEHRRDISIPLRRPEELQGIGTSADEILVRFARLPPARLCCPPVFDRPEYAGRIPDLPPETAALAVHHHLWHRCAHGNRTLSAARPREVPPETAPETAQPELRAGIVPQARLPKSAPAARAPAGPSADTGKDSTAGSVPTPEDVGMLTEFVGHLLEDSENGSGPPMRGVRRAGRLVEVRVDPAAAAQVCGGLDAMHSTVRRWAALRWVRRIRPAFVLERRALEALEADLVRRLDAAAGEMRG